MKRLVGVLFAILIAAVALADTRLATEGERTAETLKQLERDWLDAEKAGDSETLGRIVADDWTGVDNDGKRLTKEQLLARIKSGNDKLESAELGPMDVKILGDAAVVQGSDIEIGTTNGKHTRVEIIWMDVFANRGSKWVCVRSQSARCLPGRAAQQTELSIAQLCVSRPTRGRRASHEPHMNNPHITFAFTLSASAYL